MTNYTPKGTYPYPAPTDAVTDYPATAATFAGYVDNLPNRNLIINGFFDIWQRGTTPPTTVSGSYTADRWRLDWDGTGGSRSVSWTQPSLGTSIGGIQPYRVGQVAVNTTTTGGSFMRFAQRIEGVRSLAGETATLSFHVLSTVAPKTITIRAVQNFGSGGSPSSAVTTTIGTTTTTTAYARKTFTFTVPALTGKTMGTNGDDYLEIHFDLGTQTGIFNFWGVQLEQNTTATALERRPIQQELALCQRYYYRTQGQGANGPVLYTAWAASSTTTVGIASLPVAMRTAPSAIEISTVAFFTYNDTRYALTSPTINIPQSTTTACTVSATISGATIGHVGRWLCDSNPAGYIGFSAEL
jgi:hypothetical protein